MKLYVGDAASDITGLPLDAIGAYFKLMVLTWKKGPMRVSDVEAILGRTLDSFPALFMDLVQIEDGMLSILCVEKESGLRTSKSKQAASAARARWSREKMRSHKNAHSENDAKRTPNDMPQIEKREEEEEEITPPTPSRGVRPRRVGSGGGDPLLFFDQAAITPEEAASANPSLADLDPDWTHYTEAIGTWSATENKRRTRTGWLATYRQFIRRDAEADRLRKRKPRYTLDPNFKIPRAL